VDVSVPTKWARAALALLAAAAVVVVAGLVAVASAEDVPTGDARRPADRVLDLLFSFGVVALGIALVAGAVVYALAWLMRMRARREGNDAAASPYRGLAMLGLVVVALWAIRRYRGEGIDFLQGDGAQPDVTLTPGAEPQSVDGYDPHFATVPVLIVLATLAAALLAVALTGRANRRARGARVHAPVPTLDDVLALTVDDLRSEPDPRRAVIAAYARLEQALGAAGHPRLPADAPGEYLGRVLREADVSPAAVARLTTLFTRAMFSQHDVGEPMRAEAIEALEEVRADLRAAETARGALVPA
jgi:hypothetical protein